MIYFLMSSHKYDKIFYQSKFGFFYSIISYTQQHY